MPNDSSIFGSFSTRNFTGSILSSSANSFMADSVANELADELKMDRSEEHTSELQSQSNLVCRLLLEKKKKENGLLNGRVQLRRECGLDCDPLARRDAAGAPGAPLWRSARQRRRRHRPGRAQDGLPDR